MPPKGGKVLTQTQAANVLVASYFALHRAKQAVTGRRIFFVKVFNSPSLQRREGSRMEISVFIAASALVVDVVRAVFDIAWAIYLERKHSKKD